MPLHLSDVMDAADVRVRHLAGGPDFIEEPLEPAPVVGDLLGQELERDRLAQLEIVGAENLAHSTTADLTDDPIPPGHHGPRNEPAPSGHIGGGEPPFTPGPARPGGPGSPRAGPCRGLGEETERSRAGGAEPAPGGGALRAGRAPGQVFHSEVPSRERSTLPYVREGRASRHLGVVAVLARARISPPPDPPLPHLAGHCCFAFRGIHEVLELDRASLVREQRQRARGGPVCISRILLGRGRSWAGGLFAQKEEGILANPLLYPRSHAFRGGVVVSAQGPRLRDEDGQGRRLRAVRNRGMIGALNPAPPSGRPPSPTAPLRVGEERRPARLRGYSGTRPSCSGLVASILGAARYGPGSPARASPIRLSCKGFWE